MSRRHHFDADDVAEIASGVLVAAIIALVMSVGVLVAALGSQIIAVYAVHGQGDTPEALRLKRALQILVGSWIAVGIVALTGVPILILLTSAASFLVTLAFPSFVLMLGQRLGMPMPIPTTPSGELDDYLEGLDEPTVIPFTQPTAAG